MIFLHLLAFVCWVFSFAAWYRNFYEGDGPVGLTMTMTIFSFIMAAIHINLFLIGV